MKPKYNFWSFCLSTCIQKFRTIVIGCIYYKFTRLHHKFILPALLFVLLLLLCISLYQQRQLNVISNTLLFTGSSSRYIFFNVTSDDLVKIPSLNELKVKWVQKKIEKLSKKMKNIAFTKVSNLEDLPHPNYRVHIFYYGWFRTPKEDGSWQHWNKGLMSQKEDHEQDNIPPEDIYSSFYPHLGCYSSKNTSIIDNHMRMIRKAGIGVVVLSWLPPSFPDSPGNILRQLMDVALKYELKVAFQIYSYASRTHKSIAKQIQYLMMKVGDHPSLYLFKKENRLLPVFYIHESYKHSSYFWKEMLSEKGNISLRKTKYDGTFIGHLSDQSHVMEIKHASFDGLYTYSSGNGLTYGSSWKNWNSLAKFSQENTLMFIPSVGPGFSDILSVKHTRHRLKGNYYEVGWRSALSKRPRFISISSFNNWQDGSQIEPAKSKKTHTRVYFDYEPEGPLFYINLTRWWGYINRSYYNASHSSGIIHSLKLIGTYFYKSMASIGCRHPCSHIPSFFFIEALDPSKGMKEITEYFMIPK